MKSKGVIAKQKSPKLIPGESSIDAVDNLRIELVDPIVSWVSDPSG
jgi:hypothetical protein